MSRDSMKHSMKGVIVLAAGMLVSCGGGGDGGGDGLSGAAGPSRASAGMHVEESDPAVTLTGDWTQSSPGLGWGGGFARQSTPAGARASLSFTGTSGALVGRRGQGS